MTRPIDGNYVSFRIQRGTTERANEAALVENKPILSFAKSNPIRNMNAPTAKPTLDFSGLPLTSNDQKIITGYVTPEAQERIGNYINTLIEYA